MKNYLKLKLVELPIIQMITLEYLKSQSRVHIGLQLQLDY